MQGEAQLDDNRGSDLLTFLRSSSLAVPCSNLKVEF